MTKNKDNEPLTILKTRASEILQKGAIFGKNSLALFRPLSKDELFRINQIQKFLLDKDFKLVQQYLKQGKLQLKIKRLGLSFMVANNDLQPYLESDLEIISRINDIIAEKFEEELEKEFSQRAWHMIQEYVGSNVLGLRNIKRILTLFAFTNNLRININNIPEEDEKTLIETFKHLGNDLNIDFNSKRKDFDFVFDGEPFDNNRFVEMAERIIEGKKYKPNKDDLKFIKKYINRAKKLNPILPAPLAEQVKNFAITLKKNEKRLYYSVREGTIEGVMALLKASAQVELRDEINSADLERVFNLIYEVEK
jgi:hypothetical protein